MEYLMMDLWRDDSVHEHPRGDTEDQRDKSDHGKKHRRGGCRSCYTTHTIRVV